MGIWSAWVPIGTAVTLIVAPPLAQAYGWRAVWWFGAIYALAVTVLYLVVVRPTPLDGVPAPADGHPAAVSVSSMQVLRVPEYLAAGRCLWRVHCRGDRLQHLLPTFLATKRGIPLVRLPCTGRSHPGHDLLRAGRRHPLGQDWVAQEALPDRHRVVDPLAAACLGRDGSALVVVLVVTGLALGLISMAIFPPRSRLPATSDRVGWPWRSSWWAKTWACCWDR